MALSLQTPWNEMEMASSFPLHKACKDGDPRTVGALLQTDRNLALIEDRFCGWTPAHWAAYFGRLDCLKNVLSALNNGMNLQTSKLCQTPAHCAAEAGHAHCLIWLLQAGANPNLKDFYGETPLHKCSRSGSVECVRLLIESVCDVRAVNNIGELASTVAEKNGHSTVAAFIHHAELIQELGGKGASTDGHGFISNCGFGHKFNSNGMGGFFSGLNGNRFNRKRSFDAMNHNEAKRIRTEAPLTEMATHVMNFPMTTEPSTLPTMSVIEHEKLCQVEQGYTNALLHCMISEYHGC